MTARHRLAIQVAACAIVLWPAAAWANPAAPGATTEAAVRRRSEAHVYLDRGELGGLAVGQTLVVTRSGHPIGRIEVVFLARHSATARIVSESIPIAAMDALVSPATASGADLRAAITPPGPAAAVRPVGHVVTASAVAAVDRSRDRAPSPASGGSSRYAFARGVTGRRAMRTSGTISVLWEGFQDGGEAARNVDDVTGRISLNMRDIGGKPYSVRVRTRMRQVSRSLVGSSVLLASETRNRLYEVSLRYEPPEGRFSYVLGRVGVSPFVGLGYLDGGLVQVAVSPGVRVGAFGGAVPVVDGIQVDFAQTKYGAFVRFGSPRPTGDHRLGLVIAGVRAKFERGTRDYVSVETSYSSARWSLFQRAEMDFSLPTGEALETGTGLSMLSLSATYRLADRSRFYAGYHTRRDPLPGAIRFDSDPFDILFRTSLRAGVSVGVGRSASVTFGGSVRTQQGTGDNTYGGTVGVSWRVGRVRAGANAFFYDGSESKGLVGTARVSGAISRDLRFLAYYNYFTNTRAPRPTFGNAPSIQLAARTNHRVGADLTYELSGGLYLRGGFVFSSGVSLAGTRAIAEAGFRF